jgi:hypothetical protein
MILAVDRDQAGVIFGYLRALIAQTPMLAEMVANETADTLELTNGVSIEVHTSSYKSVRGRTLAAALCFAFRYGPTGALGLPRSAVRAYLEVPQKL